MKLLSTSGLSVILDGQACCWLLVYSYWATLFGKNAFRLSSVFKDNHLVNCIFFKNKSIEDQVELPMAKLHHSWEGHNWQEKQVASFHQVSWDSCVCNLKSSLLSWEGNCSEHNSLENCSCRPSPKEALLWSEAFQELLASNCELGLNWIHCKYHKSAERLCPQISSSPRRIWLNLEGLFISAYFSTYSHQVGKINHPSALQWQCSWLRLRMLFIACSVCKRLSSLRIYASPVNTFLALKQTEVFLF